MQSTFILSFWGFVLFSCICENITFAQTTRRVPSQYPTIQAAIDAAANGDTVLVSEGVYSGEIGFKKKLIKLISRNGAEKTIIEPTELSRFRGVTIDAGGNEVLIKGFTIRKFSQYGIYCEGSSPRIENNTIKNNSEAGIWSSGFPTISSNIITNDQINPQQGNGIVGGASRISRNLILNHTNNGIHGDGAQIVNNTIANNFYDGIRTAGASIYNNIIIGNNIGINNPSQQNFGVNYNNVWNSRSSFDYFNCTAGAGSISKSPIFVNQNISDFHLQSTSPCIDTGDPSSPLDPDGTRADMGAFYFPQVSGNKTVIFENITTSSGIKGVGPTHSVLFCDYNNDGLPDLYLIHEAGSTELYKNNGDRTFTSVGGVTSLPSGQFLYVGVMGDYDNDGDLDLFVGSNDSNFDGKIPCILFQNEGNGNFADVSVASGIASIATRLFAATWFDFDKDGNLDLFLATVGKSSNIFLRNLGNKTFADLSSTVNLTGLFTDTRGIAAGDYDRDGDIDIFVPNTGPTKNYLFRNDGNVFSEVSASSGVDFPSDDSHNAEFADYDNDGDLDLLFGNTANGGSLRLLKNEKGVFSEVTVISGLNPTYTYGSSFNDFDNDGYLDLLLVQGAPQRKIALYRNDGNGRFIDATSISGLDTLTTRHTLAVADLDNDGKLDVNIGAYTSDGKDQLYRNITVARNWLKIKLNGTSSNKVGIGAWLELTANSKKQYRQITAGKGYRSQDDLTQHFGLGDATIVNSLKIEWPSGIVQILTNISANQTLTVTESRRLPAAPQNLRATAGDKQITLSWNANTEADFLRYRIYGGTTPNPTTKIDSVDGVANTTKTLTGLSNGTKYYFRITAVDQNLNQSGFSNEVNATPTLVDLPPAPPKNLTATAGDKQITLKWDANSELDLLRYRIYGGIAPNPTTAIDSVLAALGTTKIITGLNNGTKYYFRITAVDLTLNVSGYSNEVSATPTTGPAAPNAPTNLAATPVSSTQINLTWSDNSSNETSFEIERKAGAGGTYAVIATRPGDASTGADNYSNTGLSPNTAYFYRVRAVLNTVTPILYSNYSNEISATTFPAIPAAPSNLAASAISNSQIRLSWNATGVTGEEGFKIYRSTSAGVAIIAGNLVGSVGINIETFTDTGLSATNTYYYKVVAFNISGNSAPSNEASATPAGDKTPPTLSAVSYAQKVNLNTDATVSLNITDVSGIKNATLYYRSGGAASFSSRAMTLQTGSTYTQTIPAAAVTNRGVEFYVAAEDGAGNLSQSPSYPIQVYCPSGIANPNAQPSGKDAGAYRIFSIPLDLDNKSPAAFLNANSSLGDYDKTKYRWYGLERSTQRLQEYPNFGSLQMSPDVGFALLTTLRNVKLKTGSGTTVVTTKPYNLALPAGWSLIGNPFNYNIPFDSLRVSAGTFELWHFDGDWQINTAGLEPWKGYAIWLSQAATFSIRAGLAGLKSTASFYAVENNAANNWLIQITAENGRSASRFNFVGQNELANDDEDQFDLHEPLRFADGVELVFNEQFTADIRQSSANGHTWELACRLNPADEMLALAFEGIPSVPPSFEIFLIDRETQTAYDLRRNPRLQFATRHLTEKRLQLIVGTKTYLDSQKFASELHPSNYVLLQNFPNPFNPATQIIYSLPEASHVEVSVYNLRGEPVATLVNASQEMGSHTVVWNAEKVGSGVYLIRIRAGRFESMKKCLLVK